MLRKELVGRARRKSYPLAITQTNLSEMTDLAPVHVKSALRALRGRDLITFGRGALTIHDCDALVEYYPLWFLKLMGRSQSRHCNFI